MTDAQQAIEAAISEIERLGRTLRNGKSKQVSADDDRQVVKATALTWFAKHRTLVTNFLGADLLISLDDEYRMLIVASDKASLRTRHLDILKQIKKGLTELQSKHAVPLSALPTPQQSTPDNPPPFSPLVTDPGMQAILGNRWTECIKCVQAEAPLAATVMMGGFLEALLLARVNQLADKKTVVNAKAAPKDSQTGKTLNLTRWGLSDFIAVAYELTWISPTTRDVGNVVRDYRNYIHPQKEHSHGVSISADDAKTLWEIAKSVARQLLKP